MRDTLSDVGFSQETPRQQNVIVSFFLAQVPLWLVVPFLGLAFVFGAGGGFVTAQELTPTTNCPESPEVCEQFGVFWQAWGLASENFVEADAVVPKRMIEGAISGMLDSLGDQGHTRYLSAEDAEQWAESIAGSFEGIGAYIDVREGQTVIVSPIEGSPAEAAGIQAGDIILEVDGVDTTGWTIEELVTNVRGPEGTKVVLTVIHPGETVPVDIEVERARVEIPSVSWSMLPGDVAYVRLNSFAQRSASEMERALTEAQEQGAESLVLDLRDNPGGLVNEALGIAGQFLPEGSTVLLEENREGERIPSKTQTEGVAQDIPMVVLINFNTASSAEIVSGALQDAGRAQVIGTPTVGTGTVLSTYMLEDGAQLLLGTSQWLTPDGRLIRNQGIQPDVEVMLPLGVQPLSPSAAEDLSMSEIEESEDAQLLEALDVVENVAGQ
jgi:carboxyl-terminal processing protease